MDFTASSSKPAYTVPDFSSKVAITFVGTATSVISIDGINILTDPAMDHKGTVYNPAPNFVITKDDEPAVAIDQLPPIDLVLISHEHHFDNLDETGRTLLNGRQVITTPDGAKSLAPRPGVRGLENWKTTKVVAGGKCFNVTGVPCKHSPDGQVIGFILEAESFGKGANGKPNAVYFSGDTIYMDELKKLGERYSIALGIVNLGRAQFPTPDGPMKITMDAGDAARLTKDLDIQVLVPLHYGTWAHFQESEDSLRKTFEESDVAGRVTILERGVPTRIL